MKHNNNIHLNIKIIKKDNNNINPWMITVQQLKLLPTRPTGSIMYTFSTPLQPTQAEEGMGRFSVFSMGTAHRESKFMEKSIHGCFSHLRIVHSSDRPAWMTHCTDCPGHGLTTVTD